MAQARNTTVLASLGAPSIVTSRLSWGTFAGDNELFDWWKDNKLFEGVERRDLTISLLNENHEPVVVWKVKRAWPLKVQSTDLKADGNEVAIESVEICHEGLEVQNG